ncbi:hypothetical protein BJX68DRAFT_272335 [Aspergillus pseudodeflectus]|uniref:Nucleoside phosphorylase domain-containing protein n=1 Tax=Aspergillus pseudodeflectus TaxID=176178 RepID=A0ABR4JG84_9EURO
MTRTHEDYAVGWICALPRELAAARVMLDEEHENPPTESIACNAYTLGRIGSHNVVLACLPVGEIGTVPAAVTATQMKLTFPRLEIRLVVGIGGGIPGEKDDIRLGDVVVGNRGVIQYDKGKTEQGGRSRCIEDSLRPPRDLLTAVSQLQAQRRLREPRMNEYIDTMIDRYPDFMHPGLESDVLYLTCYDHPQGAISCAQCDPSQRVYRLPRPSTRPVVHYGLIASGNQVMRHGATRDELRKRHDILCFEMEAAGLMTVFPSLVVRGICDYADSHKNKAWQDYAAVTAAAYAKELLSIIPDPLLHSIGQCFMVPSPVNPKFVRRKGILAMIDNKLKRREPAVLAGIGGVGKTQLALEYCHLFRKKTPTAPVFWVDARTSSNFTQSYSEIALALQIPGHDNPESDLKPQIHAHLAKRTARPWLMVLDSLDDGPELASEMAFVPSGRLGTGSVIVTTRDMRVTQYLPEWDHINEDVIAIPPLEMQDARSLFEATLRPEQRSSPKDLQDLLEMLGCFPLALTHALGFIKHYQTSVTNYKRLLKEANGLGGWFADTEYRNIQRDDAIPATVFCTWEVSFERIHRNEPPAADLLARISIFDAPRGVPETLLLGHGWNDLALTKALGTLFSLSMVRKSPDDSIMMHPLVQQAVRGFLTRRGTIEAYLLEASTRIPAALTFAPMRPWQYFEQIAAHGDEVLRFSSTFGALRKELLLSRAKLLYYMTGYRKFCAQSTLALSHAKEAYDIRSKALGDSNPETIDSIQLITAILLDQRQYTAAETKQRCVVEARLQLTCPDDISTIQSQWILAGILIELERLTEALEMCNSLRKFKKATQIWCPESLLTLCILANNLQAVGRTIEARNLYRYILMECEGDLGDEELISGTPIGLDALFRSPNACTRVISGYAKTVQYTAEKLGDKHPQTLRALSELAMACCRQQNWKEAEKFQDAAYHLYVEVLGEVHPSKWTCLSDLADIKRKQGQLTEAEKLYRKVYDQRSAEEGDQHANTMSTMYELAKVLALLERYEEACGMLKQVVDWRYRTLGRNSPETLNAMEIFTAVLVELGQQREAEQRYLQLIKLRREVLPADDVRIALCMARLAVLLDAQGRVAEAEAYYRDAVQLNEDRVANIAVACRVMLAMLLHKQGHLDEAVDLYRQAWAAGHTTAMTQQIMETVSQGLENAMYEQKRQKRKQSLYKPLRWMNRRLESGNKVNRRDS